MKFRHHILLISIIMMYFSLGISGITTRKFGFLLLILYFVVNFHRYKSAKMFRFYPILILLYVYIFSLSITTYHDLGFNSYHIVFFNMLVAFSILSIIVANEEIYISKNTLLIYITVVLISHILFFSIFFDLSYDNLLQLRVMLLGKFPLNATFNAYLIIPSLLYLLLLDSSFNKKTKLAILILFFISIVFLMLPLSRQNIVATFLIIIMISYFKHIKYFIMLIFSFLCISAILLNTNNIVSSIFSILTTRFNKTMVLLDSGDNERVAQMVESIRIGTENLLGVGIGNFTYFQQGLSHTVPESAYNQIISEMGLLFFIFFIFFLIHLLKLIYNIKSINRNVYIFCISYYLGILFLANFNEIFSTIYFWIFAFFIYIYNRKRKNLPERKISNELLKTVN